MAEQREAVQIEFRSVERHDPEIMDHIKDAPIYKKKGEVSARKAQEGEQVVTVLENGLKETTNIANEGDYIVTNPGGEQYIVGREKFEKRYEPKDGEEGVYSAKGMIRAIRNPWNSPIEMEASWGENIRGTEDAMIADVYYPDSGELEGEPYIIGPDEFADTYKPVSEQEE